MDGPIDSENKKSKYPCAIFFIAAFELLQRLGLFSVRSILLLYFVQQLGYSEKVATVLYHSFNVVLFTSPVFGGIIADNWLGRFRTILVGSLVYGMGMVILFLGSVPDFVAPAFWTFLGLFLSSVGNGVLAPCVAVFGSDQFVCPNSRNRQQRFFPVYYVLVSLASAIASYFSPILRAKGCLGMHSCYPLSFGISSIFVILAIGIFVAGKALYTIKELEENVLVKVCKCMWFAIGKKFKNRKNMAKKQHWLDFAEKKFDRKFISDIKLGFAVWKMFLTAPVFWALYDQKGSRWTFQATRMNSDIYGLKIYADQIQLLSPLLLILLIPVFELLLFPLFKKLNILQTPLKKMILGGILAGVAFLTSAGVELAIDPTDPIVPFRGEAQLRLINSMDCPIAISSNLTKQIEICPYGVWKDLHIPVGNFSMFNLTVKPAEKCTQVVNGSIFRVKISEEQAQSYVFHDGFAGENTLKMSGRIMDSPRKSQKGFAKVRVVLNAKSRYVALYNVYLLGRRSGSSYNFKFSGEISASDIKELEHDEYDVKINGVVIDGEPAVFGTGGVYTLILNEESKKYAVNTITPENYVSVLWLIPQYFLMACSEILFAITGLKFAFSQSPQSLKTLIMSGLLTSVAFGNLIVIAIAGAQICKEVIWEILIYAGIMFLSIVVFSIQAMWYQYAVISPEEEMIEAGKDGKDTSAAEKKKVGILKRLKEKIIPVVWAK